MRVHLDVDQWVAEDIDDEVRLYSLADLEKLVAHVREQTTLGAEFQLSGEYSLKRPATDAEIADYKARSAAKLAARKAFQRQKARELYEKLKAMFEPETQPAVQIDSEQLASDIASSVRIIAAQNALKQDEYESTEP